MSNKWINYHHLYYFKIIAEEGSVSKAAEKLRLGQPTLSSQLKQFEENLETILFERKNRRLTLTEQGMVTLEYATQIFKLGAEMFEAIHDQLRPNKPTIHLGALDSISKHVILEITKHMLSHQQCHVTLSEGKIDELLTELTTHRMDLIVTNFMPIGARAKGLFPKLLSKRPVELYASPQFKKLKENFPKSVSGVPMIFPTFDSRLRQEIDHWAKINKIELNIVVECQDTAMKKLMAIEGLGLLPVAFHTVARHVQLGELIKLGTLKGVYEEIYLVSSERKIKNKIAAYVIETFNFK